MNIQCSTGAKDIFVIFSGTPKSLKDGVIIHELHHAARQICEDRGVEDKETEAYMQEYLYDKIKECITDFLKGKKENKE